MDLLLKSQAGDSHTESLCLCCDTGKYIASLTVLLYREICCYKGKYTASLTVLLFRGAAFCRDLARRRRKDGATTIAAAVCTSKAGTWNMHCQPDWYTCSEPPVRYKYSSYA